MSGLLACPSSERLRAGEQPLNSQAFPLLYQYTITSVPGFLIFLKMYHILYFFFALTCFYFYRAFTIEIELCESLRFPFLFDNICRVFYWQKKEKEIMSYHVTTVVSSVVTGNHINHCIICRNTYKVVTIASQSHPQNIDSCLKYLFFGNCSRLSNFDHEMFSG